MSDKAVYKRVLLKISGEVLQGEKDGGVDFDVIESLCKEVVDVYNLGVEVVIVIGGGNFWRFRDFKDFGLDRVKSDYVGMLATVMNSIVLGEVFEKFGVGAKVLSTINLPVVEKYNRDKGLQHLNDKKIVICGGGTGSPYFTTDSGSVLRALELKCDVFLKATKVDFVYDKDPKKFDDAKILKNISYLDVLKLNLGVIDLSAISLCMDNKLPVVVFNLTKNGNIAKVIKGEDVGSKIS